MHAHYVLIIQLTALFLQAAIAVAVICNKVEFKFGYALNNCLLYINLICGGAVMGCVFGRLSDVTGF